MSDQRKQRIIILIPVWIKPSPRLLPDMGFLTEYLYRAGIEVQVIDCNLGYSVREINSGISNYGPDLIFVNLGEHVTQCIGREKVYALLEKLDYPAEKMLIGGAPVTVLGRSVLEESSAGLAVRGDAQYVITDLLSSGFKEKQRPGLLHRKNGTIVDNTGYCTFNLKESDFPRYCGFELERYNQDIVVIWTSLGCHHKCTYCYHPSMHGVRYRARKPSDVIDEIQHWMEKGRRKFAFSDDNFGYSKKRIMALGTALREADFKGAHFRISNMRIDNLDEETADTLYSAGVRLIAFGIDSVDDQVLKKIKKGYDRERLEKGLALAFKTGFEVDLYFTVGQPGETLRATWRAIKLALKQPVRFAYFHNVVPVPNTELWNWVKDKGYFLLEPEKYFRIDSFGKLSVTPVFRTAEMGPFKKRLSVSLGKLCELYIKMRHIR